MAWIGDGNNMANSWIEAAARLGFDLVLACPKGYHPDSNLLEMARSAGGGIIEVVEDPHEAVKGADVGEYRCLGEHGAGRMRRAGGVKHLRGIR